MKTTAHKIIIPLLCFVMSLMLFSAACAAGEKDGIPSSYNGYESGKLPAIRDQGDHNSGWAFAAIAAVEADLIHDGIADKDTIDLSELHLAYFANHEFTDEKELNTGDTITIDEGVKYLDAGENNDKAPLALFNMLGPVPEYVAPYSSASDYSPAPADGRAGEYQITGFYYYSSFDGFTDNDWAKTAIMEHGAVIAAYYDAFDYYNIGTRSYYCPQESETNHVITLVGWDDNFPHGNFNPQPPGDGAWLVRNSRGGGGYDYSGYFWLSYYDRSLSKKKYAFDAQPRRYAHVYSYDNCPGTGYFGTQSDKVSQSFHVDAGERIQALGFYTPDPDLSLLFTLTSGDLSVTQSFTAAAAGYYLVTLSDPLDFPEGSDVTVEYTITNGGSMTVTYEQGPYDEGKGITYDSETGSGGLVIYGENTGYDGRIKLFTNNLQQTTAVTIQDTDGHDIPGGSKTINTASYQLKAAAEPAEAAQRFSWTSSNTDIAAVNGNGKVTFHSAGTVTVTAAALDDSDRSASVTLTCDPPPATAVSIQDASGDVTGSTFTTNDAVYQLNAAAAPESALQTFTWTSSDETIAEVGPSGKVSFKKAGTVMITAVHKFNSENSASVTLTYVPPAEEVSIHDASGTDITGQTVTINITAYQLTAAAAPEGAAQNFTWTSSDETIAEVDPSGKVSFKKAGKVTIKALALDGSGKSAAIAMIYVTNETTLILPSQLTDIQASAFEGSTGFNAVILPDGVKTIGNRAFAGCSNLWLVFIPASVSSIAGDAFSWNSNLNFVCESETGAGADYARSHNIPYRIGY